MAVGLYNRGSSGRLERTHRVELDVVGDQITIEGREEPLARVGRAAQERPAFLHQQEAVGGELALGLHHAIEFANQPLVEGPHLVGLAQLLVGLGVQGQQSLRQRWDAHLKIWKRALRAADDAGNETTARRRA